MTASTGTHRWLIATLVLAGLVAGSTLAWRSSETYLRHRIARELSNVTGMRANVVWKWVNVQRSSADPRRRPGFGTLNRAGGK